MREAQSELQPWQMGPGHGHATTGNAMRRNSIGSMSMLIAVLALAALQAIHGSIWYMMELHMTADAVFHFCLCPESLVRLEDPDAGANQCVGVPRMVCHSWLVRTVVQHWTRDMATPLP